MSDSAAAAATRVVLSYDPGEIDDISRYWVENELSSESYESYIRRSRETVTEGEVFEVFVSKGCGVSIGVNLRAERVEGGTEIGDGTTVDIQPRD